MTKQTTAKPHKATRKRPRWDELRKESWKTIEDFLKEKPEEKEAAIARIQSLAESELKKGKAKVIEQAISEIAGIHVALKEDNLTQVRNEITYHLGLLAKEMHSPHLRTLAKALAHVEDFDESIDEMRDFHRMSLLKQAAKIVSHNYGLELEEVEGMFGVADKPEDKAKEGGAA